MALPGVTLWDFSEWDSELIWDDRSSSITKQIKSNSSFVFRKAYIKRRQLSDGLFESNWVEITNDVKRWGSFNSNIDVEKIGRLVFSGNIMTVQNIEGKYNPNDNQSSLWNGFGNQQRSLVKIEAGFYDFYNAVDGRIQFDTYPEDPTIFTGIISGNINLSDSNDINLPIQPLTRVFRDFPANDLTGFTSTGVTASYFMEMLRDQTDGAGGFIFRPFFGNTSVNWEITATSIVYPQLNTSSADDLSGLNVWDVVEKLAQSEQFIPYITPTGKFRWVPKTVSSTTTYEFHGISVTPNTEYGQTIKRLFSYGKQYTSFYSRVAVKFIDSESATSFVNTGLAFAVSGTNTAWNLGHRTFSIRNFWMNTATAQSVASSVFSEVSSLDEQINFSTSFIPHLNLLDRVNISYDSTDYANQNELWDVADWDTTFTWDSDRGDAIVLDQEPFKILSININLDEMETRYVCRQLNE